MSILEVKSLALKYGEQHVFQDVNFTLKKGEIIGLAGPNGAGKTSLVRVLLGLQKQKEGIYKWNTKNIGYLPQIVPSESIKIPLTVRELLNSRCNKNDHDELFDQFQINELLDKKTSDLSGGQRQKAMFVRALLAYPDAIILDEPFSALDQSSQKDFIKYLKKEVNNGLSVIVISHNLEWLIKEANQILCISKGQFHRCQPCEHEKIAEILHAPGTVHHNH